MRAENRSKRDFYSDGYYAGMAPEARFQKVAKIFEGLNGDRLLDMGCGDGGMMALLRDAMGAKEVHGVDIAAEAVAAAKRRGFEAWQLDIDDVALPFSDAYFDAVYCGEVIEHVYDPDHLLDEIYRVLKPAGTCVITTPNLAGYANRVALLLGYQPFSTAVSPNHEGMGKLMIGDSEGQWGHIRVFTARALKELLELHHFRVKRMIGCSATVNTPLMWGASTLVKGVDRIMSRFPSLATRTIAVIEKE